MSNLKIKPDEEVSRRERVYHPEHYTQGEVECIEAIASALGPHGFNFYCRGNALKYLWRASLKGGSEDLEKARWYINKLLEFENKKNEDY